MLSGVASIQGIYLSLATLLGKRKTQKSFLLTVVLASVTVRIVKSFLWAFVEELPLWAINFGFLAHSIFGPALFLYCYLELSGKKWKKMFLFHFLPSLLLTLQISNLTLDGFWYEYGYSTLLLHQGVYTLVTVMVVLFFASKKHYVLRLGNQRIFWYILLLLGAMLLQAAYISNYILGLTPYLMGPLVYSLFLFAMSLYVFKYPAVLGPAPKKIHNKWATSSETDELKKRVQCFLEEKQAFLDPNYSIKKMAVDMKVQPYKLSYVVNKAYGQNFSSFLNDYRVEKAKKLLEDDQYKGIKISAIAFECGFNSLSSFNQAFKKNTSLTPSQYRDSF